MRVWSFNLKSINQSINQSITDSVIQNVVSSVVKRQRVDSIFSLSGKLFCAMQTQCKSKSSSESKNAKRKGWKSRGSPSPSGKLLKQCWVGCDLEAEAIATRFQYCCLRTGFSQSESRRLVPSLFHWNERCQNASPLNRDSNKSRENERKWGLEPKHGPIMAAVVSPTNLTSEFSGTSKKVK